jgi:arylsulfatase A-like enzyme
MNLSPAIATAEAPASPGLSVAGGSRPVGVGPAMILLLAAWTGLVVGYLDLGLMVVKRRLIDGDFYRLGGDFVWIIPAGVAILVALPAPLLALIARLRRDGVRPGVAVGSLFFVGFVDLCARLPLDLWAAFLLSGGLAIQSARLVGSRSGAFLTMVCRTTPLLIGILLVSALGMIGGRAWSEHRAVASVPPAPPGAKNLLLIVWDTVRAGNLSLYGYERRTTPHLEELARRGTRFDLAFATASWTLPSHASLFTGRWPHELGVDWKTPMGAGAPTLAEYLGAHGYDTAGFVANLDYCSRETGLDRGFAHYEDYPIDVYDVFTRYVALGHRLEVPTWACILEKLLEKLPGHLSLRIPRAKEHAKSAEEVNRTFLDWLSWQQGRSRPFFAFLNYNDAHSPYEVPDPAMPGFGLRPTSCHDRATLLNWSALDKANLVYHDVRMAADLYDDGIAYLDRQLGRVLAELDRRGVLEDTLVIVAADHGEHLGDHILFFHGCSLYRQLVQVPLVIAGQHRVPAGRAVAVPVSLRDIPATVVDLLGLGSDAPFPGRSLARFWGSASDAAAARQLAEPLLMETSTPIVSSNQGREPAAKGPMRSLIFGGMHYIRLGDGSEELYSLSSDPEERFNAAGSPMARAIIEGFREQLSGMFRRR